MGDLCQQCSATGLPILPVLYAVAPKPDEQRTWSSSVDLGNGSGLLPYTETRPTAPPKPQRSRATPFVPALPAWAEHESLKQRPLSKGLQYVARVVRPNTYIYIYYSKHARGSSWWECYAVDSQGLLRQDFFEKASDFSGGRVPILTRTKASDAPACGRRAHDDTRLHYFVIERPEACGPTWIAFSQHRWLSTTIDQYTRDEARRNARMQLIHPAAMAAGTAPGHGTTIAGAAVLESIVEYSPLFQRSTFPDGGTQVERLTTPGGDFADTLLDRWQKVSTRFPWTLRTQREPKSPTPAERMLEHMRGQSQSRSPYVLALLDPLGIAVELNDFRNHTASWIIKFRDEQDLRIQALALIESVRTGVELKAKRDADNSEEIVDPSLADAYLEHEVRKTIPKAKSNAAKTLKEQTDLFMEYRKAYFVQRAWKRYKARLDTDAMEILELRWRSLLENGGHLMEKRGNDHLSWVPLFKEVLNDYSIDDVNDGDAYTSAVAEATFGMTITKAGAAQVDAWLAETKVSSKNSLLWRAFAMNQRETIAALEQVLKGAEAHSGSIFANVIPDKLVASFATWAKKSSVLHNRLRTPGVTPVWTGGIEKLLMGIADRAYRPFAKTANNVGQSIIEMMLVLRADAYRWKGMQLDTVDDFKVYAGRWKTWVDEVDVPGIVPGSPQLSGRVNFAKYMQLFGIGAGFQLMYTLRLLLEWRKNKADKTKETQLTLAIYGSIDSLTAMGAIISLGTTKDMNKSVSFQRFMLAGGLVSTVAAWFYALPADINAAKKQHAAGNRTLEGLHVLRGATSVVGGFGALGSGLAFTEPFLTSGVPVRIFGIEIMSTGAAEKAGAWLLFRHARFLCAGVWSGVVALMLTILIDQYVPDELQKWLDKCAFGKGPDHFKTTELQLQALQEVFEPPAPLIRGNPIPFSRKLGFSF